MLLTVAMIVIITGIFSPIISDLFHRNNLDTGAEAIKTSLRRAQVLSRSSENDSDWGVKINTGEVIIFSGTSYADRNEAFDEAETIPSNISVSGDTEIIFIKGSGKPNTINNIYLSLRSENISIHVNNQGLIH